MDYIRVSGESVIQGPFLTFKLPLGIYFDGLSASARGPNTPFIASSSTGLNLCQVQPPSIVLLIESSSPHIPKMAPPYSRPGRRTRAQQAKNPTASPLVPPLGTQFPSFTNLPPKAGGFRDRRQSRPPPTPLNIPPTDSGANTRPGAGGQSGGRAGGLPNLEAKKERGQMRRALRPLRDEERHRENCLTGDSCCTSSCRKPLMPSRAMLRNPLPPPKDPPPEEQRQTLDGPAGSLGLACAL